MQHYRCFQCYIPSITNGTRIADTVQFIHHYATIPQPTPTDDIIDAAKQLTNALKTKQTNIPGAPCYPNDQTYDALCKLADIFIHAQQGTTPPAPPSMPAPSRSADTSTLRVPAPPSLPAPSHAADAATPRVPTQPYVPHPSTNSLPLPPQATTSPPIQHPVIQLPVHPPNEPVTSPVPHVVSPSRQKVPAEIYP